MSTFWFFLLLGNYLEYSHLCGSDANRDRDIFSVYCSALCHQASQNITSLTSHCAKMKVNVSQQTLTRLDVLLGQSPGIDLPKGTQREEQGGG